MVSRDAKTKHTPEELEINRRIGAEIKRIRTRVFKMSQEDAARHVFETEGMQAQWSRWERGKQRPQVSSLAKIARKAGVPLSVFAEIVSPPTAALDPAKAEALRYHLSAALSLVLGVELPMATSDLHDWLVGLLGTEDDHDEEEGDDE